MSSPIPDVFTGTRTSSFRYELLDLNDEVIGVLDGVTGGQLTWSASTSVKAGGTLDVKDVSGVNWLDTRIKIWRSIGETEWSRGVYIPSAPEERWVGGFLEWTVELLGKLSLIDRNEISGWVTATAGTSIITKVRSLLTAAGHKRLRITDSTAVLRTTLTWEPGTKLLTIINELLDAAGYWSLSADHDGYFAAGPYERPAARAIRYDLLDDAAGIYEDDFTRERDVYSIPNRVILVSQSSEDVAPLVGIAENTDASSPYSISRRGQVIPYQETGLEVASQAVITAQAQKTLLEKLGVTGTIAIKHAPLPLDLNDAVLFRRLAASINTAHTVQSMTEPLDALSLMSTNLREVVNV